MSTCPFNKITAFSSAAVFCTSATRSSRFSDNFRPVRIAYSPACGVRTSGTFNGRLNSAKALKPSASRSSGFPRGFNGFHACIDEFAVSALKPRPGPMTTASTISKYGISATMLIGLRLSPLSFSVIKSGDTKTRRTRFLREPQDKLYPRPSAGQPTKPSVAHPRKLRCRQ